MSPDERSYYEPRLAAAIESGSGRSQGLSNFSNKIRRGVSFADVRLHTGSQAAYLARSVNARAFTVGKDVFFGAGEYSPNRLQGKRLMAHGTEGSRQGRPKVREAQLTHTVQQRHKSFLRRVCSLNPAATGTRTQTTLTTAQKNAACTYNYDHFDGRSIRIIQRLVGAGVDGNFDSRSANAVARYQSSHGLTADGKVGLGTINRMIPGMIASGCQNHILQLVADWSKFWIMLSQYIITPTCRMSNR